ncbi:MAG TPA: cell division protein FtsL [Oscillospiraceae bacterium]|nr:cell division protein FtsL [Oscillospiraceae bacterium]HNX99879.1 cell division protein FtsL [Oscillospiraceae bacterium]HPS75178.1 cell division protein FtsL [Oscillospiraceae bacterium]
MAQTKKVRYGQNAVNGNLAYDYDNPALYPEYEYGRPLDIPAKPEVREEVVPQTEVLTRQSISPLALFGFAAAAVLLVFSLMARVQFTQVSAETAKLESQLTELNGEQSKLTIAYESALNLTDIENYAINTLGMQKPRADQVHYVSSSAQDKAEILNGTDGAVTGKAGDIVDSLKSYFG